MCGWTFAANLLLLLVLVVCADGAGKKVAASGSNNNNSKPRLPRPPLLGLRWYGHQSHTLDCCDQDRDEIVACNRVASAPVIGPASERSAVGILSWSSPSVESFTTLTETINSVWAHERGYDFIMAVVDEKAPRERDIMWDKQLLLLEYVHLYRYLLYIDADAILNELDMEGLLEKYGEFDLTICRDSANMKVGGAWLNAGVVLFRNTWWTQLFLLEWWESGDVYPMYRHKKDNIFMEQGALGHMLQSHNEEYMSHVTVLPSTVFNSMTPLWSFWEPKLPVLHFETTPKHIRIDIFQHALNAMCDRKKDYGFSKDVLVQMYLDGTRKEVEMHPDDPFAQQGLAKLLLAAGGGGDKDSPANAKTLEEAIKIAEKAVKLNPKEAFHWSSLADVYAKASRTKDMLKARKKAMEVAPGLARFTASYAQALFDNGDKDEGIEYMQRAVSEEPTEPNRLVSLGVLLVRDKQIEEALKVYKRALQLDENDWTALGGVGYCYNHLGNFHPALDAYRKAVGFNPDQPQLRHGIGKALLGMGKCKEGNEHFAVALANNPNPSPQLHFDTAKCLAETGREKEALVQVHHALKLAPSNLELQNAKKKLEDRIAKR